MLFALCLDTYRRKHQFKRRTFAEFAVDFNTSAIVFDDTVADADTQSGTLADFFGCEKRAQKFYF